MALFTVTVINMTFYSTSQKETNSMPKHYFQLQIIYYDTHSVSVTNKNKIYRQFNI
jgi:hypothetical protein